jgi:hypothetical protein
MCELNLRSTLKAKKATKLKVFVTLYGQKNF